jgi:hypothetical protein
MESPGGIMQNAATSRDVGKKEASRRAEGTKTFTVSIDDKTDQALDSLRKSLGKTSRADVFRLAIALLKIADDAKQGGFKVTIADKQDKVQKEILLPG